MPKKKSAKILSKLMLDQGLKPKSLLPIPRPRVSEILAGKRYISPRMAILLHDRYGVPVSDLLLR